MTNNPKKIDSLRHFGVDVTARIPLQIGVNEENIEYLRTKVSRMEHMLDLEPFSTLLAPKGQQKQGEIDACARQRPFVTLSYAQSLDGSISARRGEPMAISGPESMEMTHRLRAEHDAILVGIGTVLSDDPRLSVRLVDGPSPQPVIVDSQLRCPVTARLLAGEIAPWIATTKRASFECQQKLEAAGARVLRLPSTPSGQVDLRHLLSDIAHLGIRSLMVEGGAAIISSFLADHLVDRLVVTIAPLLVGGLNAVSHNHNNGLNLPKLSRTQYQKLGNDIVFLGDLG
jgi:3,4-dihydroxy 2-butanone 4-phosphate synthase/GTP cyclohydrolase II